MGVVGTMVVGIHFEEIVAVREIVDVAAIDVGEAYRIVVNYDWHFAIENGADYYADVAFGVVGVD